MNNPTKLNGFETTKQIMNDCGYIYRPDKQLGALHYFEDESGRNIECDVDYYGFITKSEFHFHEDAGFNDAIRNVFIKKLETQGTVPSKCAN